MATKKIKKLICIMLCVLCISTIMPTSVYAKEKIYPFDSVNVLADLRSADGFNIADYPIDKTGLVTHPEIINVVEWCYSYRANLNGDFAIYIYFYNPQGLDIDEKSSENKVMLATRYENKPITSDTAPVDYEMFELEFCNKSTDSGYENLFYKYRIKDHISVDGLTISERVNPEERRYDISEIDIKTKGENNAKAYNVGCSYNFTGYAYGFGKDTKEKSTLKVGVKDLETIDLEVNPTCFRTTSSSLGKGHQNQLNSVYFSVAKKLVDKYGSLQQIKADWYEYKTDYIYVVNNETVYNSLLGKVGKHIGANADGGYGMDFGVTTNAEGMIHAEYSYNSQDTIMHNIGSYIDSINYLFYNQNLKNDILVKGETLENYIKNYTASSVKGYLPIKDGKISADLFMNNVDAERKKGHNSPTIDAGKGIDLLNYDSSNNWFVKFLDYGFWAPKTNDSYKNVPPIEKIEKNRVDDTNANISENLLINIEDVNKLKDFVNLSNVSNRYAYLFRFANTDYYSEAGNARKANGSRQGEAIRASETVFFDFKIIHLTFAKDGVYKVIPVVNSPIDIINDITPTPGYTGVSWIDSIIKVIRDFFKSIGAWGVLIIGVVVGLIILVIEIKILVASGKIGNMAIKIILTLILLAGFIASDYYFVKFVMGLISGLGGV